MTVDEIHGIIDEDIFKYENKISLAANWFLILGVFFTVLGLFMGLTEFSSTGDFDRDSILSIIKNLKIAFVTTIIGIIMAAITKGGQMYIKKLREPFRYNLMLLAKNILVPKYAIPDIDEKNLGKLVRTISKASAGLEKASKSVITLSEQTKIGTEEIKNSVQGFTLVTDKMSQREDNLIKALGNMSNYLGELKKSLEDSFTPLINQLQQDLLERDIKIDSSMNHFKNIQSTQRELNTSIEYAMSEMVAANKKLGKFFGEDFYDVFNESMDKLNEKYQDKFNDMVDRLDSIKNMFENSISSEQLEETSEIIINKLKGSLNQLDSNISDMRNPLNKFINDFPNIKDKLTDLGDQLPNITDHITGLSDDFGDLHKDIFNINSKLDGFNNNDIAEIKHILVESKGDLEKLESRLKSTINEKFNTLKELVDNLMTQRDTKNSGSATKKLFNLFKRVKE